MLRKHHVTILYFRNLIVRRLLFSFLVLVGVASLTLLGLYMARQGQLGLPVSLGSSLIQTVESLKDYFFNHPTVYIWHQELIPAFQLVWQLFIKSAGLLFLSLIIAAILGGSLGIFAARFRHRNSAPFVILTSILGISTPSFLLAMLFWIINVKIGQISGLGKAPLPPTGFGWDLHLILPVLVLATRPTAQIMQVTYVNLSEVLDKEFITAAKARGLPDHFILYLHALKNTFIPILTTLGSSLRFSLASLPVVESFFLWEGLGLGILQAIQLNMPELITDLMIALGIMFLFIQALLDFVFPLIDPRLQKNHTQETNRETDWGSPWSGFLVWIKSLGKKFKQQKQTNTSKPAMLQLPNNFTNHVEAPSYITSKSRQILFALTHNPGFIISAILILFLIFLAFFGSNFTPQNPYQTNRIANVNGEIYGPPFPPSPEFTWGSDALGRDILSLLLAGAKQTMTLAAIGMIARVLLGVILGMLAGWWENSWLDKFISGIMAIWAAFPSTLFAMILILAIGIQRGMIVFIITLCIIGWGEIAQVVRAQAISQKPLLYIEAARSVGAQSSQVLKKHILPHLIPTITVLSVLEMGGILMLLAELGFLDIFLGGGFRVELLGAGIYAYSDAPEWAAMLANVRNWWRSYPWMVLYPGGAFFISILSFNLFGEGLRRFLDDAKINLANLVNKYTLAVSLMIILGLGWLFRSSTPIEQYKSQARNFDSESALQHIEELSSNTYQGRETGTNGNYLASLYIAEQMEEIGLFPAGEKETFLQGLVNPRFHLTETPKLAIVHEDGQEEQPFQYREDYVEFGFNGSWGDEIAPIVGMVISNTPHETTVDVRQFDITGKAVIIREQDLPYVKPYGITGLLIITEDRLFFEKKFLIPTSNNDSLPALWITPQTADHLLKTAGSSLEELTFLSNNLGPKDAYITEPGAQIHLSVVGNIGSFDEKYYNVIGYIPGTGSNTGAPGQGLDKQVIIVSAYFDGVGTSPDGTLYPGANDNASGVATMLEMARVMKDAPFPPKKTIVFVAWSGAERYQGLSITNIMNAKSGFAFLEVEAVLEISGVGSGTGDQLLLESGSSFRLVNLYQDAGRSLGNPITNRGRGPHFGWGEIGSFGGRTALTAYTSWEGSDQYAHTPQDSIIIIDVDKLQKAGETNLLVLSVLSRETEY